MLDEFNDDAIPPSHHKQPESSAGILDAITDQNGRRWIRYGLPDQSALFSTTALVSRSSDVYAQLADAGFPLISAGSRNAFLREIEQHRDFRPGLVASQPGWVDDDHFVLRDGTFLSRTGGHDGLIGFDPDMRFRAKSALGDFQTAVAPFVIGQPLVATMLAYSLVGPLLRFLPADVGNPIVELCGPPHIGKTSLAVAVASVWGDNPASQIGILESFSATNHALEQTAHGFADMLIGVDEENLAKGGRGQSDLADFVFRTESGRTRRRHNDGPGQDFKVAALVTANVPLADSISSSQPEKRRAVQSRIVTLPIGDGVLVGKIAGYESAHAATRAMTLAFRAHAGVAGEAMARAMLKRSPANIERLYAKIVAHFAERKVVLPPRTLNAMAAVVAAALIAEKSGLFPTDWSVSNSVFGFARSLVQGVAANGSILSRVHTFLEECELLPPGPHRGAPLPSGEFADSALCIRDASGEWRAYVGVRLFRSSFPDFEAVMRTLRDQDLATTEGGKQKKLTVKAPARLSISSRAYCIYPNRIAQASVGK